MSKENELNESNIEQIYLLYKEEFINYCENILIENQNEFLDKFYEKMDLILKYDYGENIFEKIPSLYLTKKQCENKFITDIYWPMRELCLSTKKNFEINNTNNPPKYLVNFRPHCLYDQVPLHTCGSKFIPVLDKNIKDKILYVICSGCDKCYYSNFIIMNCHYCQIDFYSEIISNNNLFLSTWKKYHCNNDKLLINEQMHCILCNNLLYIKNNKLFCKICEEYFAPEDIMWTCKICKTEFKSDIKIYNPYEYKEIELAKKEAFLYKKISKPSYLPCNCISNEKIKNFIFSHEPIGKCKGDMYYCLVNNKEFLVCSLCFKVYQLNKFYWKCPVCYKNFIVNELIFEEKNKEKNKNNFYKKINVEIINTQRHQNYKKKNIHNSCSQKIINTTKNENAKNNKIFKNKNNSYVKKRVNSSFIKTNTNNDLDVSFDKNHKCNNNLTSLNKTKLLSPNNNIKNNNSIREINSLQNKYNLSSTAYSSFMNNNLKEPQTDRNTAYSFILPKIDKTSNQSRYRINKYINKKILNYPTTIINNPASTSNKKIYLKSKYKTIEQYINEFNYNEKANNKYIDTMRKSINAEKTDKKKNGFIKIVKNGFKKLKKNKNKENSFCISNPKDNKSFISQKTDKNQIYIPKKHIHNHRSSLPSLSTSPLFKSSHKNIIKFHNSCEKRSSKNNYLININNDLLKSKLYLEISNTSREKNNNNNLSKDKDLKNISKKKNKNINKNRKRNHKNELQNLTENNKGTLISTMEDKNKNINDNNISFSKYMKTNYINKLDNKNIKEKKEMNSNLKLNLEEINNNIQNKHNGNRKGNKYEFLTSYNNHRKNYIQIKQKNKKENNINKNKNLIKKKLHTSQTKNGTVQNSKYRNSKKYGLVDILSNFKDNKNSMNHLKKKSIDKNETNPNLNNTNNNINININNNININKTLNEINLPLHLDSNEKEKDNNNSIEEKDEDELSIFNFEEYKIITQLGQGSFGKIYLVQNAKNELFTMKKLVYSEELDVKSVIKEYKMCYKLKHPNVVKILGIYSKKLDKTTFVVYVLMEVGMTDWEKEIKTHIEKNIFYTEKELIDIIKQLIQVLSFLQKKNISHRDIKPQNILVFKNNIYKIADFGEAKQIENMTINLLSNSLRGTELYMSPLLFNGLRTGQVDIKHNVFKSDVYSFGLCILFAASLQMVTLYDIRRIVDMKDVNKYLDKMLKDKYSKKFIDFVGMLLEIHEKNRPDFIQLEKMVNDLDNNE